MKRFKYILLLQLLIFMYSLASVCSKYASSLPFLSFKWCALYALMIFILGVYAILWQQILKKLPLNLAYSNKAITILWGTVFGILLFDEWESINVFKILGAVIVVVGVVLMVTGEKRSSEKSEDTTEDKPNE